MLCKNCKYFKVDQDYDPWGDCINPKFATGYNVAIKELDLDQVLIEDDEGWAFNVGPEFGCIHYAKL